MFPLFLKWKMLLTGTFALLSLALNSIKYKFVYYCKIKKQERGEMLLAWILTAEYSNLDECCLEPGSFLIAPKESVEKTGQYLHNVSK